MLRRAALALAGALALSSPLVASAQTMPPAPGPAPYEYFVKGATVESGFITIIKKAGNVYFGISPKQLDEDLIESSVPATGLGGFGPAAGEPYVAPARIFRFSRVDNKIVMSWPAQYYKVNPNTPEAIGVKTSFPSSIISVVPIVSTDAKTGMIVFPASAFLGDVADMASQFRASIPNPAHGYHLDPTKSFFKSAKALPDNDILHVSQTWSSFDPNTIDNVPDARNVDVQITYNIAARPNDHYMPRIADARVGYFSQPVLDFATDSHETRNINYINRWNFAPETPGKPSNATHPLVFYIANDVPLKYRATVKAALLTWNDAFAKVGILNAVQVKDQPNDPKWDPEDLSHNMVRWILTSSPQYGAEALIMADPLTGEDLNVGVNVDAVEGMTGNVYKFIVAPARGLPMSTQAQDAFVQEYLRATVLHESGHDLGLQHNFIGSEAYTTKNLQSTAFTSKYGVASSVMEYAPINLWPKGTRQGDYSQLVLGPYDYYAINYGYANIPNATTPEQEVPTLNRLASKWANPTYRFASDEDVFFGQGHAIDPRVAQFDLTNHPLTWCQTQVSMLHGVMNDVSQRFPLRGRAFDQARMAFLYPMRSYMRCAMMPANTIGGEYLSRSHQGDPGSWAPLTAVPRSQEVRAWGMLAKNLFSDAAWNFNPYVLTHLTYSEVSSLTGGGTWAYNPPPRHDVDVAGFAAAAQETVLNQLYAPLTLQRIDSLPTKYGHGKTMSISDLFNWSVASIYGDVTKAGMVRRGLQMRFMQRMARMWVIPTPGTPGDARALARQSLVQIAQIARDGANARGIDSLTRAHLSALAALADEAVRGKMPVMSAMGLRMGEQLEAQLPASLPY
ncbi:MAG: zinc-dependent metalloprotease [Vulcanimicrobiaceae bacterium]